MYKHSGVVSILSEQPLLDYNLPSKKQYYGNKKKLDRIILDFIKKYSIYLLYCKELKSIIGYKINNINYYFEGIIYKVGDAKSIKLDTNNLPNYKGIINILYDPYKINKLLNDINLNNINSSIYNKSINNYMINNDKIIYKKNLYNILLLHCISYMNQNKKYIKTRQTIINKIITLKNSKKQMILTYISNELNNILNELYDILSYNDLEKLKYIFKSEFIDKKIDRSINNSSYKILLDNIINIINKTLFNFDNEIIEYIKNISDNNLKKEIDNILIKSIKYDDINNYNNNYFKSLKICFNQNNKSNKICKLNKFIITKELYNKYLNIMVKDLKNDFKINYIFNPIIFDLNSNIFIFEDNKYKNTNIFITKF